MFPVELKQLKNWVGYKLSNKIPLNPLLGNNAKSNDRSTWGTYNEATQAVQRYQWDGIGFMFEPPYIGIDLDDCVENGKINDFAKDIIRKCNSYTEYSPSKTGVHIIGKGNLNKAVKTKEIEIYNKERYFTVTNRFIYPPRPLREIKIEQIIPEEKIQSFNQDGWISEALKNVSNGSRNNDFTRIAGSLRARGYSASDMFNLLVSKAREVGFGEQELSTICESVSRYAPSIRIEKEDTSSFSSILSEQIRTEWLVNPQIISKQSITFLVGLPEAQKTWMLMDLALALATGTKWLNRFECKKSKVIYLDQERSRASTVERFNALTNGRGLTPNELDTSLLLKPQSRTKLNLPQSFETFTRLLEKFNPDVVLVDSFKKIHSNNELSSQDMQALFTKTEELKDRFGCSFVFIHHETKGVIKKRKEDFEVRATDAAGTIDLQQTAEHFFNAVQTNEGSTLYHTKNNLGDKVLPCLVKVIDINPEKTSIKVEAY